MQINPSAVHATRTYNLTDVAEADTVRDSARCPLTPTMATVRFSDHDGRGLRATYIEIEGRRQRGAKTQGTFNRGGFSITNGTAMTDYRGNVPPAWVQDVVALALAEQAVATPTHA